jgi:hypothetical protein
VTSVLILNHLLKSPLKNGLGLGDSSSVDNGSGFEYCATSAQGLARIEFLFNQVAANGRKK